MIKSDRILILLVALFIALFCMLLYMEKSYATIVTKSYSVLRSNLTQRIDTGCEWDGVVSGVTIIGYYQTNNAGEYELNQLMPAVTPGKDFFNVTFSSSDLTYNGFTLSHVVIMYGEKAC